jgi:2-furoyl-CoA dehydrogenase FAD binding subunit
MKPSAFEYIRPGSLGEALDCLKRYGEDARIIAGGLSLVPAMNYRLVQPKVLIDIADIKELDTVRLDADHIEVGAAATQARLLAWPELATASPLLAKALPHVGHFQTRSRGTVCGSIAHSDPSSELPLCLATLGGSVILRSKTASREVGAADFQLGLMHTARKSDEMVMAVRFPLRQRGAGYAFHEMAERQGDLAICAVAAKVTKRAIRLGVGGVAEKPAVREWNDLADSDLDAALNQFAWDLEAGDDTHGTAVYRRQLVRRLGRRAILEARECRN